MIEVDGFISSIKSCKKSSIVLKVSYTVYVTAVILVKLFKIC